MTIPCPILKVEIAFTTNALSASPVWTDVTSYTLGGPGYPVSITRGRSYELDQIQPATLSLTLNNDDGRFTPERTSSPYYPNVQTLKQIRVSGTLNGITTILFVGHIDSWPHSWLGTIANGRVQISATDAFILASAHMIRSLYEEEVLSESPLYYWTLTDQTSSTFAMESSRHTVPGAGGGGGLGFGGTPFGTGLFGS